MALAVVYEAQRCAFYADTECYTRAEMPTDKIDALKADIM